MCSETIAAVVGALIAGLIGFIFVWWQRRRDGHDRFLAVIGELEAELDGCEHIDDKTKTFHAGSLIPLRCAVFAVQPFICKSRFKRLLDLWHEYRDLEKDKLTPSGSMIERTAHELTHGKDSPAMPPYPDERLRSYLKKFREEVG
jgi:hypothetical protein